MHQEMRVADQFVANRPESGEDTDTAFRPYVPS